MATKARPAKVKAGEDRGLEAGQFEAIVSVFGTTDSVGDKVLPGAFAKSLSEWGEKGKPIPVIWTHSHGDAFAYIGDVLEAEEREGEGLWIKGRLDVDPDAENATARQVYRLLKGGRIDNWSFAYDVEDEAPGEDGANELRQLKLYEVGPTLVGAHQDTHTLAVKHLKESVEELEQQPPSTKAGRVLSAKNEDSLRQARDLITNVLAVLDGEAEKEGAPPTTPAKDETPSGKSEEPKSTSPADYLTVISIEQEEI